MAKKHKKNSKINQRIRKFFDGDPFDVGVERVDASTLSEMFATIGIYDIDHSKEALLKVVRMLWSDADLGFRQDVLDFFEADGKIYPSNEPKRPSPQKEQLIEELIAQLDVTQEEAVLLHQAFEHAHTKRITISKMESKLRYIRFTLKREAIEKRVDGHFDIDESIEFNASIGYELYDQSFHKIVTLNTKPYSYQFLDDNEIDTIVAKIEADKTEVANNKQKATNMFVSSLRDPHPYLTHEHIINALRSEPPHNKLNYPPLPVKLLKEIIDKKIETAHIALFEREVVLQVPTSIMLPYSQEEFAYTVELHLDLDGLLEEIWQGRRFDFNEVLEEAKHSHEEHFLESLSEVVDECGKHAQLLHLAPEALHKRVYSYLLELLPKTLTITPKIKRKTLRIFLYNIQEELVKKQRQELLKRTIRDFKNLFPLARDMRRKLTLHIGPTNSGKTYTAMQKLQNADTGYYLAPLRLLALEGYEKLQEEGVEVSLITGEEQIIDEEATHISSTIEMLNFDVDVDVCVIDEVQMIDDRERGWAWANAIIGAPAKEIIMTGSANVKEAIIALAKYLGEELEIVEFERKNELVVLDEVTKFEDIQEGSAVVAFSRKDVLKLKSQLSQKFSVSVVYGNLSPEVRREEARRFREGETQVLVATDAIAMGMNLPIKTILFSTAEKFDGITQRKLFVSEVQQIAGRAGRYGLHEKGYVGALSRDALRVVKKNFYKEAHKVALPFKVMANLEHIKLVSSILEENSLEEILKFFIQNMEFSGPFYAASLDDMLEAAAIIDKYELDIATKYHLACAPLTLKSPYILDAFESYIAALEKGVSVHYRPLKLHGAYAKTSDELLRAEDMVKEISLYLWLSYRFGKYFVDESKARAARGVLNRYIEQTLQHSTLSRPCRLCSAPLPANSRYSICQRCFKKNYTHRRKRS